MPPFNFYRRRWRPNWRTYRKRRFPRRRRPRQTFRRRFRRKRWVRRRSKKFYKKLKRITLKVWQPKSIRKCTIKGPLCLFACGIRKISNNFTLFSESYVPEGESGGGAWSIMQLTLSALWDEYIHFKNWWTVTNDNHPLVRYLKCKFKFYRSKFTDYVVVPQLCPPFAVTRDDYLGTQPLRLLMNKNKIIVPKLTASSTKKYIKRTFFPPSMWTTNWYFQQDVTKIPLIVLKTAAMSLNQPWQPEDMVSYNITLHALSTFFENPKFKTEKQTAYSPKTQPQTPTKPYYLYGTETPNDKHTYDSNQLIRLTNTNTFTRGKPGPQQTNWGNPFHPAYGATHSAIYYSTIEPKENFTQKTFTPIAHLYQTCRYNPFKDKGTGNKVYFKSTSLEQGKMNTLPTDAKILITDIPLWIIFWGWSSWLKKLHPINHMETDYLYIVQSPYIYPKQDWYVFIDMYFVNMQSEDEHLTETEKNFWHPRYDFQQDCEFYFAQSGPYAPKINMSKCIQANCFYSFYVKWGGCPAHMDTFTNPEDQERFPIPNNFPQTNEIKDPTFSKFGYIYEWDEKRQCITKTAAKRIKTYESPTKYFAEYGTKDVPHQTQTEESDETTDEEKAQTSTTEEQLLQLKLYQKQLKRQLRKLRLKL
nr:MAG: ORF1 [TTV-like mini virus]